MVDEINKESPAGINNNNENIKLLIRDVRSTIVLCFGIDACGRLKNGWLRLTVGAMTWAAFAFSISEIRSADTCTRHA